MRRHRFVAIVFALAFVFFCAIALRTPGDVDEGFYAIAGELAAHGRVVYRDFFYPQAPALPYVLAPLLRLAPTFVAARVFMAGFGALTAALIAFAVQRETGSRLGAAAGAALFCIHELSWQWIGSVRAYSPACACAVLALVLLTDPRRPPSVLESGAAGALAALAGGMRLLLVPMVAAVLAGAVLRCTPRPALRGLLVLATVGAVVGVGAPPVALAIGAAIAAIALLAHRNAAGAACRGAAVLAGAALVALPIWLLVYRSAPAAFVFGNVGYHALRAPGGLQGAWQQNAESLAAMLGSGAMNAQSAAGAQFLLLLVLNVAALGQSNLALRLAPWIALVLLAAADLRPNPVHEHYFTPLVPLLALGAGVTLGNLAIQQPGASRWQRMALPLACVVLSGVAGAPSFAQKWWRGQYGPWSMAQFRPFTLDAGATRVREALRAHPGSVLPAWPGSALGSATAILPGFEDHFARNVAEQLTPEERRSYHVPTPADFVRAIEQRVPSVVVVDREAEGPSRAWLERLLEQHGYERFGDAAGMTEVYVRANE